MDAKSDDEEEFTSIHRSTIIDEEVDAESGKLITRYDLKLGMEFVYVNARNTLLDIVVKRDMTWTLKLPMDQIELKCDANIVWLYGLCCKTAETIYFPIAQVSGQRHLR